MEHGGPVGRTDVRRRSPMGKGMPWLRQREHRDSRALGRGHDKVPGLRSELRGGEREGMRLKDVHLPKVEERYTACSVCICISQIQRLSTADKLLYQAHLAKDHGLKPEIEP